MSKEKFVTLHTEQMMNYRRCMRRRRNRRKKRNR